MNQLVSRFCLLALTLDIFGPLLQRIADSRKKQQIESRKKLSEFNFCTYFECLGTACSELLNVIV